MLAEDWDPFEELVPNLDVDILNPCDDLGSECWSESDDLLFD